MLTSVSNDQTNSAVFYYW